ncbi:MAG: bifunctional 2-polyprenyl-6-hydroxyphenol methylase/3-demethylubiquinol 3-O-methyltransferase UbiG [Gammaproteobacteria bacterium]
MTATHATPESPGTQNLDPEELARFGRHARDWWDPRGPLRTLHALNPVRLRYIDAAVTLSGKSVLDVGCGGGLLCEAMARKNARVTGIDASPAVIDTARSHRDEQRLDIEYAVCTAEQFAAEGVRRYDAITCMELLEHVPDPPSLLRACARLLEPGGSLVLATINRTLKAYAGAILGAEYVLRLLPRGTHDYARFIRPSEIRRWLGATGLCVVDIAGVRYVPWLDRCSLTDDPSINYLLHARLRD